MKKLILPIFFFLIFAIPVSVSAQFPSNCWDIMQDNSCLENFTECNIKCGRTTDQKKYQACAEGCDKTYDACSEERTANYKACVNASRKASDAQEVKQLQPSVSPISTPEDIIKNQSPEPTDQRKATPPVQDLKDDQEDRSLFEIPLFIDGWFNALGEWIKLTNLELSLKESEWEKEKKEIEELKKQQAEIRARLEADLERQAREAFWKSVDEAKFVAGPGDQSDVYKQPAAEYKKGGNSEFEPLSDMQILNHGDIIQVTRRAIIRTPNYVIEIYPRSIRSKAVIEIREGKLILKEGAVTIWKGGWGQEFVGYQYGWEGIETPVLDAVDVQTQYTIAHDGKANKSYVIVSEGEVKVTTKDGATATITPNGGKLGIAVVSQKLSPTKLALAGVVLAAVLGTVIMILRRKFAPKGFGKKKR